MYKCGDTQTPSHSHTWTGTTNYPYTDYCSGVLQWLQGLDLRLTEDGPHCAGNCCLSSKRLKTRTHTHTHTQADWSAKLFHFSHIWFNIVSPGRWCASPWWCVGEWPWERAKPEVTVCVQNHGLHPSKCAIEGCWRHNATQSTFQMYW